METGDIPKRCRLCRHWEPLFRGDAWGVRSFADAPIAEQHAIWERLKPLAADPRPGFEDVIELLPTGMAAQVSDKTFSPVKAPADWPMWGHCRLTDSSEEVEGQPRSLAHAIDGSDYFAVLRCHATFGCIQWKLMDL